MTLALHLTVQKVGRGNSPEVLLTADADELVIPQGWGTDSNAITSTTEGNVRTAELRLVFDEGTPLEVGQVITVNADFAPAEPDDEDQGGEPEESSAPDDDPRPATARKRAAKKAAAKKAASK